jgi:hypothetical protein
MSVHVISLRRTAGIATLAAIVAAAAFTAGPSSAKPVAAPAALAKQSCAQAQYRDRSQAPSNAAGIVFNPKGDSFQIWDNQRDNHLVAAWFNYAGVKDKWKPIKSPDDGGQRTTVRNLDERFSQICFVVVTHNNQSPIVRFTTRP